LPSSQISMIGFRSQTNHSLTADEILLILSIARESPVPNIRYLDQSEKRQSSSILQRNLYRTRLAESVLASIAISERRQYCQSIPRLTFGRFRPGCSLITPSCFHFVFAATLSCKYITGWTGTTNARNRMGLIRSTLSATRSFCNAVVLCISSLDRPIFSSSLDWPVRSDGTGLTAKWK
jgi:hypothetical protein